MFTGDTMRLQRWHLYGMSCLLFMITFIYINDKFDPFYRVNGIDNDNRALIELYLDEEEQTYLIEHAIAMSEFVEYIHIEHFYLPYYEYYNLLAETKIFKNVTSLINNTNYIIERLEMLQRVDTMKACNDIIENDLVLAFINQESFDIDYIPYYQKVRALYSLVDYSFVDQTNEYVNMLLLRYDENELENLFTELCLHYTKSSLQTLLTTDLDEHVSYVVNPTLYNTIVNDSHYIGSYTPSKLVVANDINRTVYSIYLEEETYDHLLKMYEDITALLGEKLLLSGGYRSFDLLEQQQSSIVAGFNEYQLGTTVEFLAYGYSNERFLESVYYDWLLDNAHLYGFILRNPSNEDGEGMNNVFRYVGVELATKLYEEEIYFDAYIVGGADSES